MRILITGWGLDAYLDHLHAGLFDAAMYRSVLRPDIMRLRTLGTKVPDRGFTNSAFWGPAQGVGGGIVKEGWKMKWHNFGSGRVQFRLCVALVNGDAFLCHAYVKTSPARDRLLAGSLKDKISLIYSGNVVIHGELK